MALVKQLKRLGTYNITLQRRKLKGHGHRKRAKRAHNTQGLARALRRAKYGLNLFITGPS